MPSSILPPSEGKNNPPRNIQHNKFFAYFLQNVDPELSTTFRKVGNTYQTFGKTKHKFVYDTLKNIIIDTYKKVTFNGYEYGAETVSETYNVICEEGRVVARKN